MMDENGFGYKDDHGVTFIGMLEIIVAFLAIVVLLYLLFS